MRRRCSCPCPTHPPKPGTVQAISRLVPPLPEPLAGAVCGKVDADGNRKLYFAPYADGRYGQPTDLPVEVPATWLPYVERVKRFLAETAVKS